MQILIPLIALTAFVVLALITYFLVRVLLGLKMPTSNNENTALSSRFLDSVTLRFLFIAVLGLLMLIPLGFITDIVYERGDRHREVLDDIAQRWGQEQILAGPVLVIPFTEVDVIEEDILDDQGNSRTVRKTVRQQRTAKLLPGNLEIEIKLAEEIRARGIFHSLVYTADVLLEAQFDQPDIEALSDKIESIHWEKAWISVGLTDTRAINHVSRFEWNNAKQTLSPGSRMPELPSGFHATLPAIEKDRNYSLAMTLNTKGSGAFQFAPFGTTTTVSIQSGWPHPSFQGSALPNTHEISASGFSAQWEIPHLARNYPQAWVSGEQSLFEFTAGVSMFETLTLYTQVTRAVKYGLLFVGLTFLTLLIFEIMLKQPLHPVQYALVGTALSVFFLVLLSISEHLSFLKAYAISAMLTLLMITVYTAAVLRSVRRALAVFALLAALYVILFSLLQLEDYALLLGTALLVSVIAVLMLVTRNLHYQFNATSRPENRSSAGVVSEQAKSG